MARVINNTDKVTIACKVITRFEDGTSSFKTLKVGEVVEGLRYVKDKKIDGISDLRDESDRDGMRVVIELKRDANAQVVLNQLFKHTQMQTSFGVIMLALVNNKPKVLNIKEMLYEKQEKVIKDRRNLLFMD